MVVGATLVPLILVVVFALWPRPELPPPFVSVDLLSYTNGTGPFARLAFTNRSPQAVTLSETCLVNYSPGAGTNRMRTMIDANTFRIVRLEPHEGFEQEFFVFPAPEGLWQFECHAAYSSTWLEVRRSVERWSRKVPWLSFGLTQKDWHAETTPWTPCPP